MTFDPTRIYDVVHPAPMTYLARGARKPSRDWARMTTPVRLRHVDADAARTAFVGKYPVVECLAFEGALWTRISGYALSTHAHERVDALNGNQLAAWLGDADFDRAGTRKTDLDAAFARTPVKARIQSFRTEMDERTGWTRGEEFEVAGVRQIVEDGREAACDRLLRFFAENVVVAGDRLLVRCGDPVALLGGATYARHFLRSSMATKLWANISPIFVGKKGEVVSQRSSFERQKGAYKGPPEFVEGARILDASVFDPLDHAVSLAHTLPELCAYEGMRMARLQRRHLNFIGGTLSDDALEAVVARCRTLEELSLEFAMGGVTPDRARTAMVQALALWDDVGRLAPGAPSWANVRVDSWMGRVVDGILIRDMPLLDEALKEAPSPEDEEAMNGLAF